MEESCPKENLNNILGHTEAELTVLSEEERRILELEKEERRHMEACYP